MSIIVFDTETTGLEKCFCYDVGYYVLSKDKKILAQRHFIIEQVWHNLPLFATAYYADKRPLYVKDLRCRKAELVKWGNAMRTMANDIKKYNVEAAYAYNSSFDDKVFTFNCDYFHTNNPLDTIPVFDIWGYASQFITNDPNYIDFCEQHELFTDSGNYKGSAESVYKFLTNSDFVEEHRGLEDSEIEALILFACIEVGAEWEREYNVVKVLPRIIPHEYEIRVNGKTIHKGEYIKKYVRDGKYYFTE